MCIRDSGSGGISLVPGSRGLMVTGNAVTTGGLTVGDSSADVLRFVGELRQGSGSGTAVIDSSRRLQNLSAHSYNNVNRPGSNSSIVNSRLHGSRNSYIANVPFGDAWHDLFAHRRHYSWTYETSTDNSSFSSATINDNIFDHNDETEYEVLGSTIKAARWTITNVSFGLGEYISLAVKYKASSPAWNLKVESSTDGTSYTTRLVETGASEGSQTYFYKIDAYGGATHLRITLSKQDLSNNNGLDISRLCLWTPRPGDQGKSKSDHYPFDYVRREQINLLDNQKLQFGNSNDLQIYHDVSYSYIREVGTGDLRIAGASNVQIWNSNIDSQMANFANGGAATLYYAGAAKLATTSAGAAVTGNLSVSGNLTVTGTTTTVDTVTMNAQNAVVFEGATADAHETTLTIIDPTADRTINLPNQSGTIPVLAAASNTAITATPAELNYVDGVTSAIQTQLDSKQATISSSTDLTLSSIVASSSNESRFNALSIGPDADIYLYQSATNEFTIRTGTSGAYKYFTFESGGNLNLLSGGLETGGTERISSGGNLTNIGTISSGTITTSGNIIMNSSQYIDLNGSNIIDVEQIVGIGSSGWLDFNMDTDNVYPQSTTDNQTVLGSVTHMNFVGDSNANGTGGTFNFGYGVSHLSLIHISEPTRPERIGD